MSDIQITDEKMKQFIETIEKTLEGINYRELNVESWYQQLLENEQKTEEEDFIFQIMDYTRKLYCKIEEDYRERQSKLPWANTDIGKRMGLQYYDWDSRPILQWEYSFKHRYFPVHVGDDIINGWRISTVWLGLNLSFGKNGDPIIFETMIFKEDEDLPDNEELLHYQERYSFLKEAAEGHREACKRVREITEERIDAKTIQRISNEKGNEG